MARGLGLEDHLAYCSDICCLASLKQALYVKEQLPESEVTIYYIDRRTPGRNEEMLTRVERIQQLQQCSGRITRNFN